MHSSEIASSNQILDFNDKSYMPVNNPVTSTIVHYISRVPENDPLLIVGMQNQFNTWSLEVDKRSSEDDEVIMLVQTTDVNAEKFSSFLNMLSTYLYVAGWKHDYWSFKTQDMNGSVKFKVATN